MNPTRRIILQSLMHLTQKKKFTAITVDDILAEADVSRTTFYRYFRDKYDLRNACYRAAVSPILDQTAVLGLWEVFRQIYAYAEENKAFYQAILQADEELADADTFRRFFKDYTIAYYSALVQESEGAQKGDPTLSLQVLYLSNAQINTMMDWIRGGCVESPERLADIMVSLIPVPLQKALNVS